MSDLYNALSKLCQEKGITGYRMCKDVGIQPSIMTDLKMGRRSGLKAETAQRIADYFGVSVGYLLGTDQKEKTPILTKEDERDIARDLETFMADLTNVDSLMFDGNPLTDEARESIMAAMKLGLEAAKLKSKSRLANKREE
jgi:transcriptional regulator with XRE-family HTH domain